MGTGETVAGPAGDDGAAGGGRDGEDVAARLDPVPPLSHPGRVVAEAMAARGLDALALAAELGCPAAELEGVLAGERRLTPDLAAALGRAWGGDAAGWVRLQTDYDRFVGERARN